MNPIPDPPTDADLAQRILQLVRRPRYRPVKPRAIAKQLKLDKDLHGECKRAIKRLAKQGKLTFGANHLVHPAKATSAKDRTIVGVFRRTASGHGFVRPAGTQPSVGRDEDLYVPSRNCRDASNGDTVAVVLHPDRRGPRGKREIAEVVEVLERSIHQFVGTYQEIEGVGLVQVDANVFTDPIEVGDPGAKNARPGDKVVFEMVRFPTHARPGEGVLVEVLGRCGDPEVDTLVIMREYALPDAFPEAVLEQARGVADEFDEEDVPEGRNDLRDWTTLTIDPQDARDFDDAISLRQLENGHWQLAVHIADVSHFVRAGTPLDQEARERATSVYLPNRVLPMLPEIISNHLASLQPQKSRYSLTALMEMTADGARVSTEVVRGVIRSDQRLSYEEVDGFLEQPETTGKAWPTDVVRLLREMHTLAMILRARRMHRGALELTLPEIKLDFDKSQRVRGAHLVQHTESHQIIEEFMLAANEAVAERLEDLEIGFLRRIHEAPDPRKLEALTSFVREIGIPTEGLRSRFELKRVLHAVEHKPTQYAVNYAVLRSMQKAVYSPEDAGHFALGSTSYCHFTSPIRRYPDLTIHRIFHALLDGKTPDSQFGHLVILGQHCSDREQRAEVAERELIKLKLLQFLSRRVGALMDAVITGVQEYGFFAQGITLPAEGLVAIHDLPDDRYHFDRTAHTLTGAHSGQLLRLGDIVRVEVARVDVDRRELDLRLVKQLKRKPARPKCPVDTPAGKVAKPSERDRRGARSSRANGTHSTSRRPKKGSGKSSPRKRGRQS